jgi:putative FmdB family regulatory protein
MPIFEYDCPACKIFWEKEAKVGKAPKKTKCPQCGNKCERYHGNANINVSFKDNGNLNAGNKALDFHSVRSRYYKHIEKGFDKDSANRFLNNAVRDTKEALSTDAGWYKPVQVNWDKVAKDKGARRLTDKEVSNKIESAKKLTSEAYDNANKRGYKDASKTKLDIHKPTKQM